MEKTPVHPHVAESKQFRKDLDDILQRVKHATRNHVAGSDLPFPRSSRERSLARTKIEEAIMWLGMDLKSMGEEGIGEPNPYPHSKDPASPIIDKTADGLKL